MGNQLKNVAAMACLKTFLIALNIVYWIGGVLLLMMGIWAEINLQQYIELTPEFSGTIPYVLIGLAAIFIVISTLSFSCIIKGQPVLLCIYGALLGCIVVMIAGVQTSVAYYKDSFPKSLRDGLRNSLMSHKNEPMLDIYNGYADFRYAQTKLQCCGVSNYTDWLTLTEEKIIPVSCCIAGTSDRCSIGSPPAVYNKGCYEVIVDLFHKNINLLIGVALGMTLCPVLSIIMSCALAAYIKNNKYHDSVI